MESVTILTPLVPAQLVFCFPSEPNIPEGPEYKKNINTVSMHGEKFYLIHTETTTAVAVSRGCLRFVLVVFPGHTHLLRGAINM